jgi:hypothetical protein
MPADGPTCLLATESGCNVVRTAEAAPDWTYGIRDLMRNLAAGDYSARCELQVGRVRPAEWDERPEQPAQGGQPDWRGQPLSSLAGMRLEPRFIAALSNLAQALLHSTSGATISWTVASCSSNIAS